MISRLKFPSRVGRNVAFAKRPQESDTGMHFAAFHDMHEAGLVRPSDRLAVDLSEGGRQTRTSAKPPSPVGVSVNAIFFSRQ